MTIEEIRNTKIKEHIVTGIEKYYTLLDNGRWVGTPTTIYPVEKGDYDT